MLKIFIAVLALTSLGLASAVPEEKNSAVCEVCTVALTYAQDYLEQNATEEQVLTFIKNELCSKLGSLQATCDQYVDAYGQVIIYQLAKKIDPSIICKDLGLCTGAVKPKANLKADNCALCKLGVNEIVTLINTPQNEQSLINFLNTNVCSKLGQEENQCKSLVQLLTPTLFAKIISLINADKICQLLKLCSATKSNFFALKDSAACLECKLAVSTVLNELKNPAVQDEIIKELESACSALPSSFQALCNAAVESYGPQLLAQAIQWIEQENVCKALKICDN